MSQQDWCLRKVEQKKGASACVLSMKIHFGILWNTAWFKSQEDNHIGIDKGFLDSRQKKKNGKKTAESGEVQVG